MTSLPARDPDVCTACALCRSRRRVVLPDGPTEGLMAVGEAPGRHEDEQGVGFAGPAGGTLDRVLAEHGLARRDYARTNVVRCRPPDNRRPRRVEIAACRPWLTAALNAFAPRVLLAVGQTATAQLLPYWKDRHLERLRELLDRERDDSALPTYQGIPVVPMPHTSGLAWNRRTPDGYPISELGHEAVARAVAMLRHPSRAG